MVTRIEIELVNKVVNGPTVSLIAECNGYDANDERVWQYSRSPFEFDSSLTDEEIIADLAANQYSIYTL